MVRNKSTHSFTIAVNSFSINLNRNKAAIDFPFGSNKGLLKQNRQGLHFIWAMSNKMMKTDVCCCVCRVF